MDEQIIWSHRARIKLFEILKFYTNRNQSKTYSAKLYRRFNKELRLLIEYPHLGVKTDIEDVRGLIVLDYILFYEVHDEKIIVHTIWPSKQNPKNLIIK